MLTALAGVDGQTERMVARLTALSRLAAMAVLLLVLSGCLEFKAGLQVNTDDTVTGQLTLFAPKSELTSGGLSQEQGFQNYRNKLPKLPTGGLETPYDDGTNYGVLITYNKVPLSQFTGSVQITHADNHFTFSVNLDPAALAATVPNGDANSTRTFLGTTSLEISVTLPGTVAADQTNGTVIGGNTVVWNIAAGVVKPASLTATSTVVTASPSVSTSASPGSGGGGGSSSLTIVLLIVAIVVILLLAVLVVVLVLRRRPSPPTSPAVPSSPSSTPSQRG